MADCDITDEHERAFEDCRDLLIESFKAPEPAEAICRRNCHFTKSLWGSIL